MIDSSFLSTALTERFGLDVSATVKDSYNTDGVNDGQKIIIEPAGIENTISFKVELTLAGGHSLLFSDLQTMPQLF